MGNFTKLGFIGIIFLIFRSMSVRNCLLRLICCILHIRIAISPTCIWADFISTMIAHFNKHILSLTLFFYMTSDFIVFSTICDQVMLFRWETFRTLIFNELHVISRVLWNGCSFFSQIYFLLWVSWTKMILQIDSTFLGIA